MRWKALSSGAISSTFPGRRFGRRLFSLAAAILLRCVVSFLVASEVQLRCLPSGKIIVQREMSGNKRRRHPSPIYSLVVARLRYCLAWRLEIALVFGAWSSIYTVHFPSTIDLKHCLTSMAINRVLRYKLGRSAAKSIKPTFRGLIRALIRLDWSTILCIILT